MKREYREGRSGCNRSRTRAGIATFLFLAAFAIASAPAGADPYTFLDLTSCCSVAGSSTTLGPATIAAAVNDNGDVAGTSVIGGNQAFIVKEGALTLLEALPSEYEPYGGGNSPFSGADDLNDADTVVGWSSDGAGTFSRNSFGGGEHPVVWRPFAAAGGSDAAFDFGQLETSPSYNCNVPSWDCYGVATNVTETDDAAGQSEFTHEPVTNHWYLYPWLVPGGNRALVSESEHPKPPPSPDMVFYIDIGATTATSYYVSGIRQGASASQDQVVVWPDPADSPQALGDSAVCTSTAGSAPACTTVPLDTSYHQAVRHAINSSGMVIGRDDTTGLAGVWSGGAVTTLAALPGDTGTEAAAINDSGDVVGASIPSDESSACPSAVLWPAGKYDQPIDLNAAESSKDEQLFLAQDISNTDDIVGQGGTCDNGVYTSNAHPWELIAPAPAKAKLTVSLAGSGSGAVSGSGSGAASGIDCPTTCAQDFALGSQVSLTATPSGGSTFSGFSGGGCSGAAPSCVVTMTQAQEVTATFSAQPGSPTPKCTLVVGSRAVLLKRSKKNKRRPGTLAISAKCTQKLSARLTGTVTVPAGTKASHGKHRVRHVRHRARHGRHKARTYEVHAVRASLAAGKVKAMVVKLPAAALTALRHHRHESAMFALTGTNANGTARATARIKALRGLK